jgi:phage terminase large subunit GpA-like protein
VQRLWSYAMSNAWRDGFLDGLRPEQPLTVSEWADLHRRLSSKASAEPGPWRTDRTPYLREPMDCLSSESPVQRVVMMFAAQTGKTEAGSNWLGYVIDHAPGPMLCVQPTIEMAKRLSKQRLESMITETPVLAAKIAPARSRDSGNTMFSKEFSGGIMLMAGANSATGLRSAPCRYLFCDEVDAFPADVDGEGDPVSLAERRTTTFARRKILLTSTPTVKDFSRIEAEYQRSDQRRFYVPCPACGAMEWLKWGQLKWADGQPESARYQCEHCGERFEEMHKPALLRGGEWRATAPSNGRTAGFHLSGLYSPLGWCSWEQLVDDFLRAKGDAPALKSFVNTRLAETWEEDYAAKVSADGLLANRLDYKPGVCPTGVVLLTAGVDVQDNRLAVSVWGWGEGETGWLVWHQELMGDPTQTEVWGQLDQVLATEWSTECGKHLKLAQVAVDSGGHCTHEVYRYVRDRGAQGVVAIKGSSRRNSPAVGKGNKVDVNWRGKVIKRGVTLYQLGTDTIKTTLFGRLRHNETTGGLNFGLAADDEYFRQLTSERQALRYHRGFPIREWVKKAGDRNEALDCAVYGYAAMLIYGRKMNKATMWEQLRVQLEEGKRAPLRSRKQQPATAGPGFVSNW